MAKNSLHPFVSIDGCEVYKAKRNLGKLKARLSYVKNLIRASVEKVLMEIFLEAIKFIQHHKIFTQFLVQFLTLNGTSGVWGKF